MMERLRRGQAQERDRKLAHLLIERGLMTPEEAQQLRSQCSPGELGGFLVQRGKLSADAEAKLRVELGVLEVMETASQPPPEEVSGAADDTRVRVGRYVLLHVLGVGGMGEVWKGWDSRLGRSVALKFMHTMDTEMVKRFQQEATLAARLTHPGIARIYEVGVAQKGPFIAMEFIEGRSLEGLQVDRREAATIVRDAARAVQYAHEQGVIHRDLKPHNIMRAKEGRIYITDFGLARATNAGSSLTVSGALIGTPSFMSPEQARGDVADVRTDIYGLGATLYALVEGHPPFEGQDVHQVINRVTNLTAPRLTLRDELEIITGKAMERERPDRYTTAGALADDLDRYLSGEPIAARPIGRIRRAVRRMRRHPRWVVSVALILALVGVGATWLVRRELERQRRVQAEREADTEIERAREIIEILKRMTGGEHVDVGMRSQALRDLDDRTRHAVERAPHYAVAWFVRGLAMVHQEKPEEAEECFSRVLESDPGHLDARTQRGLVRCSRVEVALPYGELKEGVPAAAPQVGKQAQHFLRLAREDFALLPPERLERGLGEAMADVIEGKYDSARSRLVALLQKLPYITLARVLLAEAELRSGNAARAKEEASIVISTVGKMSRMFGVRAYAWGALGKLSEAIEDARESLRLDGTQAGVRAFLAFRLAKGHRWDEAVREYDIVLREWPDDVWSLCGRSLCYQAQERLEEALRDAERACQLDPKNAEAHVRRGKALSDPSEAEKAFTQALQLDPKCGEAYAGRALRRQWLGESELAQADYEGAVDSAPNDFDFRMLLGLHHLQRNRLDEAETQFNEAVRCDGTSSNGYEYRGKVRYLKRQYRAALTDLEKAVSLKPSLAEPLKGLIEECRAALEN